MKKIPVGILGATGVVGQQYVTLLSNHPWFEVRFLAASASSAEKSYSEAVGDRWHSTLAIPEKIGAMRVRRLDEIEKAINECAFVFSSVNNETAKLFEERFAEHGLPVLSNASYHRASTDVPVLIPEVNPGHIDIISLQRKNRNWSKGFILAKPNCALQSYMIPLTPLHNRFGVKKLAITTLQAMSGAGYPGVPSMDIVDNVIPYIPDEEEKSEQESLKMWGHLTELGIASEKNIALSVHCNRVPVLDGHLACVSMELEQKPHPDEVIHLWQTFQGVAQELHLPSAPAQSIHYLFQKDRPQPRLDRLAGSGMSVTVGRLRPCSLFHYRFVALSHNTIRGAAGGMILNAELLFKMGYFA
jgi:aspartate-semialdehyde dehydrogenase